MRANYYIDNNFNELKNINYNLKQLMVFYFNYLINNN